MKLVAVVFFLVISSAAQFTKRTASLIIRDAATGEAPKHYSATLVREIGAASEGRNPLLTNGVYRIDEIPAGAWRLELMFQPVQGEPGYRLRGCKHRWIWC